MKVLAWVASWVLYGLGNFCSLLANNLPKAFGWLYPSYNNLMFWSMRLSDKYNLGVWTSRQERLDNAIEELRELMFEDDELTPVEIINYLLEDMDELYVIKLAEELKTKVIDQCALGLEVANSLDKIIDVKQPTDVIFMNPRNGFIPGIPVTKDTFSRDTLPSDAVVLTDEDYKNDVIFQIGKAYRHSAGREMLIVGRAETTLWGNCLIAEEKGGLLIPVGEDKDHADNWHEIPLEEWNKNFS